MNPGSDLPSSEHFSHQECSLKYKSYSWINRILGASGLLVVATLYTFIRLSDLSVYIGAVPENLVAGVGHLPYQYRVLIPWVVTLLQKTPLPGIFEDILPAWILAPISATFRSSAEITATLIVIEIVVTIATILSFIALCARFVVNQLPQIGGALILICLLSALQVCTPGAHLYYPSDTLAVLIVILCYLTLFSGRIVSFYSLFILGSFNRETTVFLLPLLWFLPPDVLNGPTKPSFAGTLQGPLHSLVLLGLWVSIKLSLFTTFRQNQGLFLHPNFIGNVIALQSLPTLCAFLLPVLACATVALYAARRCGDPRLAAAGYACMVYVVGIFLAGALRELRVYDELMPLIALCLLVALTPKTRLVGLTLRRVS